MKEFIDLLHDFVFLFPLFMSFVWMIGALIFYYRYERRMKTPPPLESYPFFSIIVPCHNEERHIRETIATIAAIDYPYYEIIAVDDGSTDDTGLILHELNQTYERLRTVYLRTNQGKGPALNTGCLVSKGEFILSLDADAGLDPQALKWMAWHFQKFPRVGAITGNPRVRNRTSLLGRIQVGEYACIIGLIKRTQRILGKVLTVSGVIAAFRRQALVSVGMWSDDMVTEDIDITWKLEKRFWDVRYEPRAVCWVLVPETLRGLWRQRLRWAQGGIEVLGKHHDVWQDWRQRRLWPLYMEYVVSVFWAYSFLTLTALWFIQAVFGLMLPVKLLPPIPPRWTGSMLALTCVTQFAVSMHIDKRYEKRFFKYLFWVIWYPFAYWMISAVTVVTALPKALLKKKGKRAVWRSPDRGLDVS